MTAFKKTIFGRILGGVGKVVKVAAPIALGVATGGAALGLAGAGSLVSKVSGGGLFSKIGGLFKKKKPGAGTVLGNSAAPAPATTTNIALPTLGQALGKTLMSGVQNAVSNVGNAAMSALGESVGSTAHAVVDDVALQSGTGEPTAFGAGVKKGFLTEMWESNKALVLIAGAVILAIIFFIIKGFKRR
jgi:hypothetical protein